MSSQELNRRQFGRSAADYVTSSVHANGWTLQRMVDLVQPEAGWQMLDIATGGGHTALIFAPHVAEVMVTDLTQEMLDAAAGHLGEKGVAKASYRIADACALPFDDASFDLITCRIAPHHFPDIFKFLQECARVIRPGGTVAIVDNIVPDGAAGEYINAFEKLRDPGHVGCFSAEQWQQELFGAGLTLEHVEKGTMAIDFYKWTKRMRVSAEDTVRLEVMLRQAPAEAKASLTPEFEDAKISFYLQRIVLIAKRE